MKANLKHFMLVKCILFTFTSFLMYVDVKACDCIIYPVSYEVKKSEDVIIAKVIETVVDSSQLYPENKEVVLEVTRVFKGKIKVKERFTFITDGNCDPRFIKNEEYLLFCFRQGESYHTYHCSYSDKSSTSSAVIKKIEKELRRQ